MKTHHLLMMSEVITQSNQALQQPALPPTRFHPNILPNPLTYELHFTISPQTPKSLSRFFGRLNPNSPG